MTRAPFSPVKSTRRSVLRLLGATPLAIGSASAASALGQDRRGAGCFENLPLGREIPADLLPGGAYDAYISGLAAQDQFSGTVQLALRGRSVLAEAFGSANEALSVPNRVDTIYSIASITKCFTAVAVLQLIEQGSAALYEPISSYLEEFAGSVAGTATLHQLLTHTGGMGDYTRSAGYVAGLAQWDSIDAVMNGVMALIEEEQPLFTPGTRYAYSNSGYFVLGKVVASISGQSYFDYVAEHIFRPAGMLDSGFYTRGQVSNNPRIARPYWTQASGRIDFTTSRYNPFVGGPDGGAYCTAPDLLRFVLALHEGTLLGRAFTELLTSSKFALPPTAAPATMAGQNLSTSYGFDDTIVNGQMIFGHPGGGPGRATNLDVYPDLGWVAIILSNYDTSIFPNVALQRQLITEQADDDRR